MGILRAFFFKVKAGFGHGGRKRRFKGRKRNEERLRQD